MLVPAGEVGAMFLALVWVLECACITRCDVGWVVFFPSFCILFRRIRKRFFPLKKLNKLLGKAVHCVNMPIQHTTPTCMTALVGCSREKLNKLLGKAVLCVNMPIQHTTPTCMTALVGWSREYAQLHLLRRRSCDMN